MLSKAFKAVFLIGTLFFAFQSYSQCFHCSAPAAPAEYGGVFNATMYKNAKVQLWAAKPSVAIDGRQWYRVKQAGDTTFVGNGDTMVFTMDTSSRFICRNVNNCTCGGTYYSNYTQMASITVVDSPSVPQYWFIYDSVICSGTPTNIFTYTNSSLSGLRIQYFRDDTPNVTGSITGTAALGPLGVTLTNTIGTAETVRIFLRLYKGSTYFDSKSFYVKVLPAAPSGTDHCSFPSKPQPGPNISVDVNTYGKGAQVQFLVDTTVIADTVKWYKVVGADTSYIGKGYSVGVTMDTTAKFLARAFNVCSCNGSIYASDYALIANNTVSINYVSHIIPLQIMDTIASGTGINILTKTDTTIKIEMFFYRDNANVTGSTIQNTIDNYTGTEGFDAILTNTTNVPQRIRYKIYSRPYAAPGSVYGDTYTGYFIVMPSSFTAPPGNHCYIPSRTGNGSAQVYTYSPGANVYLDLNKSGFVSGAIWTFPNVTDAVEWFKVRGQGDTVFVGDVTPVSTTVDTTIRIFTVSRNVCYWSDSSKHVYRSVPTFVGQFNKGTGSVDTPTHVNNRENVCSNSAPDITYTGSSTSLLWYRNNPKGITGAYVSVKNATTSMHTDSLIRDTLPYPVKVYYVGIRASSPVLSSNVLDSFTVYPDCTNWANFSTVIHALKDSICPGDTATLTADTVPGIGSHYVWSTGDTTKTIHPTTAGTYTVTVTNSCGCSATATHFMFTKIPATITVIGDTTCIGQPGHLTASGGISYSWNSGISGSILRVFDGDTYTVTATGANGCTASASSALTLLPSPDIAVTNDTICFGDTATLTVSAGYKYAWSTSDTGRSIKSVRSGIYSVTATNSLGCSSVAFGSITVNPIPWAGITTHPVCPGDTAILLGSNAISYVWNTGATSSTLRVLSAGAYGLTITDANGCSATTTAQAQFDTLHVYVNNQSVCLGSTATLTATGGQTYIWSTGETSPMLTVSTAGIYRVTATNLTGCIDSAMATVTTHGPSVTVTSDTVVFGDTARVIATGGSYYLWTNGEMKDTLKTPIDGVYGVTVTDSSGCSGVGIGTITLLAGTAPKAYGDTINPGDTATLFASGGARYLWSTGEITPTIKKWPITTTIYHVTVTMNELPKVLHVKAYVNCGFNVSVNDQVICRGQSANLAASIIGSNFSPTYVWSTGDTSSTIAPTASGDYSVTVSNSSGCNVVASGSLIVNGPNLESSNISVFPGDTAILASSGGVSYLWSTGGTSAQIKVTSAGIYSVTAYDSTGCSATLFDTVTVITMNSSNGGEGSYVSLLSTKAAIDLNTSGPVGTTPGFYGTTPTGAATYSIPVTVPPGTGGMAPKIALEYNSQHGDGPLGWGWALSGLSTVSRAGLNNFLDHLSGPITISNDDHFLLDGQILMPLSGTNGSPGTRYGKENEDYSIITSEGTSALGPEWFKVVTKQGAIIEYGHTSDSRIENGPLKTLTWQINKVSDLNGNYILFKYENLNDNPRISEIDYTGNDNQGLLPYNKVKFSYLDRVDKNTTYAVGAAFNSNSLLSAIAITGENNAAFKKYQLNYGTDDLSSYLVSVTEYGSDGSHLNPTLFTYGGSPDLSTYFASSYDFRNSPTSSDAAAYPAAEYQLISGDFNGDGISDVTYIKKFLNTDNEQSWNNGNYNHIRPVYNALYTVNVKNILTNNYDKIDEQVHSPWDYTFSNNMGSFTEDLFNNAVQADYNYFAGDFLGSGRDGILEIQRQWLPIVSSSGLAALFYRPVINKIQYVTYDNSSPPQRIEFTFPQFDFKDSTFVPGDTTEKWFYQGDFDGDHTQDFIISTKKGAYVSFPAKGIFYQYISNSNSVMLDDYQQECNGIIDPVCGNKNFIGDFDGDGKSDFISINSSSSSVFTVAHNEATSVTIPHSAYYYFKLIGQSNELNRTDYNSFYLGDFNGDGKTDILTKKYNDQINRIVIDPYNTGYHTTTGISKEYFLGTNTPQLLRIQWDIWRSDGLSFLRTDFKKTTIDQRSNPTYHENYGGQSPYTGGFSSQDLSNEKLAIRDAIVADFNGDGKSDILLTTNFTKDIFNNNNHWYYTGCGRLDMYYSQGNSFKEYLLAQGNNYLRSRYAILGDFNGDGRVDAGFYQIQNLWTGYECPALGISGGSTNDYVELSFSPKSQEKLLRSVVDAFGEKTEFNYRLMTDRASGIHTQGLAITYPAPSATGNFDYPVINTQFPAALIYQVTSPDGIGGTATTQYRYERAMLHSGGRGFLGFYRIDATTLNSGFTNSSYFVVNPPFFVPTSIATSTAAYPSGDATFGLFNDFNFIRLSANRFAVQKYHDETIDYITNAYVDNNYSFDNWGNIISATQDNNGLETTTTTTQYATFGTPVPSLPIRITLHKERTGGGPAFNDITANYYDFSGHLRHVVSHLYQDCSTSRTFTYDGYGNAITEVSAISSSQKSQSYQYDAKGRFRLIATNALGQREYFKFHSLWGSLTKSTNVSGLSTYITYDAYGRESMVLSPRLVGTTTTWSWALNYSGRPTIYSVLTQRVGMPDVTLWYDSKGRKIISKATGFGGQDLTGYTTYDHNGKVEWDVQPAYPGESGSYTFTGRDSYGRVTASIDQFGTSSVTYNCPGNGTTEVTTALSTSSGLRQSTKILDPTGKVISATDNGGTLTFKYDGFGNQVEVNMSGRALLSTSYDACNHILQSSEPNSGSRQYSYDGFGQLLSITDAKGNTRRMQYDNSGRIMTKTGPEGSISYTYKSAGQNGVNQVAAITGFGAVSESYDYDVYGLPLHETRTVNGKVLTKDYEYAPSTGRLIKKSYGSDLVLKYEYDANGYLQKIKNDVTHNVLYQINNINCYGQATSYSTGNGKTSTLQTSYGRPTRYQTPSVQDLSLEYDPTSGDLLKRTDNLRALSEEFTYDNSDRLKSSQVAGQTASTYTYQGNGNLASKSDVGNYLYDPGKINAVRHVGNTGGIISSLTQNIDYTAFDQPAKISENNYELSYSYDINYQRCYSELKHNGSTLNRKFYWGDYEITDDGTGGLTQLYYVKGLNGLIAVIAIDNGNNMTENYIYSDQIGSILRVTDNAGNVIADQNFDAWGRYRNPNNWTYTSIPAISSDPFVIAWLYRGFTGHEHLNEFMLINTNGRLYDPLLGRMLSPDLVIHDVYGTQYHNKYSYVYNNPLKYSDPLGWEGWDFSYQVWNFDVGITGSTFYFHTNTYTVSYTTSYVDGQLAQTTLAYNGRTNMYLSIGSGEVPSGTNVTSAYLAGTQIGLAGVKGVGDALLGIKSLFTFDGLVKVTIGVVNLARVAAADEVPYFTTVDPGAATMSTVLRGRVNDYIDNFDKMTLVQKSSELAYFAGNFGTQAEAVEGLMAVTKAARTSQILEDASVLDNATEVVQKPTIEGEFYDAKMLKAQKGVSTLQLMYRGDIEELLGSLTNSVTPKLRILDNGSLGAIYTMGDGSVITYYPSSYTGVSSIYINAAGRGHYVIRSSPFFGPGF